MDQQTRCLSATNGNRLVMPTNKEIRKANAAAKRKASTAVPPPNWPPLTPLIPTSDLSFETLLDDQVIVTHNLLTSTLCKAYVSFLSTLPLKTTPYQPRKGDALRINDRFQVDDPAFTELLWNSTGLKRLITSSSDGQSMSDEIMERVWGGVVVGLNPRIRIYRYKKGQFFGQHCMLSQSLLL